MVVAAAAAAAVGGDGCGRSHCSPCLLWDAEGGLLLLLLLLLMLLLLLLGDAGGCGRRGCL
jgi:hypothetical protein